MSSPQNITCPNCGTPIDIDEILAHQTEERIRKELNQELANKNKLLAEKQKQMELDQIAFEAKRKEANEEFIKRLETAKEEEAKRLALESAQKLEAEKSLLKKEIEEQQGQMLQKLMADIELKNQETNALKKRELELLEEKRLLNQQTQELELKFRKEFLDKEEMIRSEVIRKEQEKNEMKEKEFLKKLEDQKKLISELQRKAEQGSMQMQGEVQELAIEDYLKEHFPLDYIEEIKKGQRGADCLQWVNTYQKEKVGAIYYESKRTKDFQATWIEKFKADMREKGAQFGVLVSEVLPKDMDRLGQKDGIWICSYEEFKGLSQVLREAVILLDLASASQENKGDKMVMLYDFLTGPEFRMQVEAIVEGFTQMHEDLNSERRAMESIWKKREKQIQKVLLNTQHMYGSIKGIAGNSILSLPALELNKLPEEED